jgi:hypothetical protein
LISVYTIFYTIARVKCIFFYFALFFFGGPAENGWVAGIFMGFLDVRVVRERLGLMGISEGGTVGVGASF